jgi:hypothetical protein
MKDVRMLNNMIAVSLVDVAPKNESSLIGVDGKKIKGQDFEFHPYQAKVEAAPDVFYNNGIEYPCPVKKGDVVALKSSTVAHLNNEENYFVWQDKQMFLIRVSEVVAVVGQ